MPGIGRDLLDLPFAELVRNLAIAIADGQRALDQNSIDTMHALVETNVDVITDITEIIEKDPRHVTVGGQDIEVTGAKITPSAAPAVPMSLFQAGLMPSFYQFTEASIEVRLSITMREDDTAQRGQTGRGFTSIPGFGASRAYASSVDFRSQNKYAYTAQGASVLKATIKPIPPPARLEPAVTTINALTSPITVTRTPG